MVGLSWAKRQLLIGIYALLGLVAVCALSACLSSAKGQQAAEVKEEPRAPNVVLILTDDLAKSDVSGESLENMPNLRSLMKNGTTFENAFVTNSLCCPSRATFLRGQYAHNHQILSNEPRAFGDAPTGPVASARRPNPLPQRSRRRADRSRRAWARAGHRHRAPATGPGPKVGVRGLSTNAGHGLIQVTVIANCSC